MDTDRDTLAAALYVGADELLKAHPERLPSRPRVGLAPRISDAEIVTLSVMQALLGYTSETRWIRFARVRLTGMFPTLPGQSGYNKRLRKLAAAGTLQWITAAPPGRRYWPTRAAEECETRRRGVPATIPRPVTRSRRHANAALSSAEQRRSAPISSKPIVNGAKSASRAPLLREAVGGVE